VSAPEKVYSERERRLAEATETNAWRRRKIAELLDRLASPPALEAVPSCYGVFDKNGSMYDRAHYTRAEAEQRQREWDHDSPAFAPFTVHALYAALPDPAAAVTTQEPR
jgi:hypothetical protein